MNVANCEIRKKNENKQTANFWLLELFLNMPPKHLPKKKLIKNFPFFKFYYKVTEYKI